MKKETRHNRIQRKRFVARQKTAKKQRQNEARKEHRAMAQARASRYQASLPASQMSLLVALKLIKQKLKARKPQEGQ